MVQHKHYSSSGLQGAEHNVPGSRRHVDGYLSPELAASVSVPNRDQFEAIVGATTGADGKIKPVAFEFLGDIWHGNPSLFDRRACNYVGLEYGTLFDNTMERLEWLRDEGYAVVYIWESDFNAWKKQTGRPLSSYCLRVA